ncbi:MAG: hypothetical protein KC464_03835 [Myxococcales bacterium]|nr:hypothetical protein [Myxococcales bacterium]
MRRIFAIALVLTVFLPSLAFARAQYRCGMDGKVRGHACCPAKHHRDALPGSSVTATSCCKVLPAHEAAPLPAVAGASQESYSAPPCTVALDCSVPLVSGAASAVPYHASDPPARGASLFVRHCALLL